MAQPNHSWYQDHDPQSQNYYPPPPESSTPNSPYQTTFQPYFNTQTQTQTQPPNYALPTPSNSSPYTTYQSTEPQYSATQGESIQSPQSSSSSDPLDKRLRNTAASARFRAKKKRREQSLERAAKEKREMLAKLEDRIRELEAENKFLKGLIFDKEKLDAVKGELERVRALKKGLEDEDGEEERDDGVGTRRQGSLT